MLLSVIIPTHNRADMVGEAIESVLTQDYFQDRSVGKDFELLVVDDGSTDNTKSVVQSFGNNVTYVKQNNRGVSSARNLGLKLSRGSRIAFLDSDDIWLSEKVRIQMGFMNTFPGAMVCYSDEIWIRDGRRVNPKKKHHKYSGWIFDHVLSLCLLSLSSAMFRKNVFKDIGVFDESLPTCEDYDLSIRLAFRYPVHLISKPLIVKRGGHPGQLSQEFPCMDRFRVKVLENALSLDLTRIQRQHVEEEIVKKSRILALGYAKRGNTRDARTYQDIMDKYEH